MPPFLINLTWLINLKYYSNVKKKPFNTILLNLKLRTKIQLNQRKEWKKNIDCGMLYSLTQHLWLVLCWKLWNFCNICINNDYFVNKLSTFVFQNISIIIHCNNILNEILFLILHLHIITWKCRENGPLFQVRRGPKSSWNVTDHLFHSHLFHILYFWHF
jgi:hypothetical protein